MPAKQKKQRKKAKLPRIVVHQKVETPAVKKAMISRTKVRKQKIKRLKKPVQSPPRNDGLVTVALAGEEWGMHMGVMVMDILFPLLITV